MLLKGSTTVIAPPGGGTGAGQPHRDVAGWPPRAPGTCSSGLAGALLAQGLAVGEAAAAAAYLHGMAARLAAGGAGTPARRLARRPGQAVAGRGRAPDRGG